MRHALGSAPPAPAPSQLAAVMTSDRKDPYCHTREEGGTRPASPLSPRRQAAHHPSLRAEPAPRRCLCRPLCSLACCAACARKPSPGVHVRSFLCAATLLDGPQLPRLSPSHPGSVLTRPCPELPGRAAGLCAARGDCFVGEAGQRWAEMRGTAPTQTPGSASSTRPLGTLSPLTPRSSTLLSSHNYTHLTRSLLKTLIA